MKRITVLILMLVAAATLLAQDAEVVYVDYYEVEVKRDGGTSFYADFGDLLQSGDSVVTTPYGTAELELASGGTVTVGEDTVYTLSEIETDSGPQTVMSVAVGAVKFKFSTLAGNREPTIGTPTSVAGVRGTEFTAYVAVDGSTVFVVDEGAVEVSSSGSSVALAANQGVEVLPGQRPGRPFDVLERAFDFSSYNQARLETLLANPAEAVEGVRVTMDGFLAALNELIPAFNEKEAAFQEAREKLADLRENGTEEDADKYYDETYVVIRDDRQRTFKNMRFYARSALSLRQYVLGRIAVLLELESILGTQIPGYDEFRAAYELLLADFQRVVVPALDPTDI